MDLPSPSLLPEFNTEKNQFMILSSELCLLRSVLTVLGRGDQANPG